MRIQLLTLTLSLTLQATVTLFRLRVVQPRPHLPQTSDVERRPLRELAARTEELKALLQDLAHGSSWHAQALHPREPVAPVTSTVGAMWSNVVQ